MTQLQQGGAWVAASTIPLERAGSWALASLALAMVCGSLGTSLVNVALPLLADHFGASFASVQWVVIAYLLAGTASIVLAGRLGDLFGSRRLLLVGLGAFVLASLAAAVAPSLGFLVVARAVQGGAAAGITALSLALARSAVPRERTGAAMGLLGTMSAVGTALGPSLGGALVETFGWRMAFVANVPLALAAWVLGHRWLARDPQRERRSATGLDVPGAALLAITLVSLALSTTIGRSAPGPWAALAAVVAVAFAGLFFLVERRSAVPLVPFDTLRTDALWLALASNGAVSAVVMATMVVGPFHLVRGLGLDAAGAGGVMAIGPVVSALVGFPAGRRVDALGPRRVAIAGLFLLALGALLLAGLAGLRSVLAYAVPLGVLTAGYALFQAANNTAVMADIAAERRGVVSGLLNLSRNLGLMLGATVLGAVFALASGASDVTSAAPDEIAVATRLTFLLGAVLVVVVLALKLWRAGARR